MVVALTREPTQEEFFRMGRAAAAGLMNEFGTMARSYQNSGDTIAESARFNQFNFPSVRYANEYNDSRWLVTEDERDGHEEDDEDDEF